MSWDIFVQDLPAEARSIEDIPQDFKPSPLCTRSELIRLIQQVAPDAAFADPAWGSLETPTFSVEFNLGDEDPIHSFALHVRGDESGAAFVSDLLSHLNWRALDPQSPPVSSNPGLSQRPACDGGVSIVIPSCDSAPPNLRLKLTARGGRLIGNWVFLIAAAAGRSLSANR